MKSIKKQNSCWQWIIWVEGSLVVIIIAFCLMYLHGTIELQQHGRILATHQQQTRLLGQLTTEAIQYRVNHPAIEPLLQGLGVRPQAGQGTSGPQH